MAWNERQARCRRVAPVARWTLEAYEGNELRVSVILAHPDPGSMNHAIAEAACETLRTGGHAVSFHDLCAERFDPLISAAEIPSDGQVAPAVAEHCREIALADGIVIVHPNWWGQPPAVLKGWIDRVLRPGVAYRFLEGDAGEGVPEGLLRASTAVVFNTSNTDVDREERVFGDPLETIWRNCIFGLCGVSDVRRVMFRVVVTSTPEQRSAWLAQACEVIREAFPGGVRGSRAGAERLRPGEG